METVNVKVPENYNGTPIMIELREGAAIQQFLPEKLKLGGLSINAIADFVAARKFNQTPIENEGVVSYSVNPDNPFIKFVSSETDPFAHVLEAKLVKNPDLESFAINTDKFFTQKELERLVRKQAHCFVNQNAPTELLANLRNFQIKYEQMVEKKDDRMGNTKNLEETAIKFAAGSIELHWDLKLELFKGTDPVEITLDLEIEKDTRSNMPTFGFYSPNFEAQLRAKAIETITQQIEILKKQFVCLRFV